jgi:hypothetical protein
MYKKIKIKNIDLPFYNYRTYKNGKYRQNFTRDEHRLIMEKHLGRILNSDEVIDHINGNKKDNRLSNLRLMSLSEHSRKHMNELYKNNDFRKKRIQAIRLGSIKTRLYHTKTKFTCCHCKKLKHKSKFWPDKSRWSGLRNSCIECEKGYKL